MPSLLPLAQHCGYAVTLAQKHPEGSTAATLGTKFHADMERYIRTREGDPRLASMVACLPAHVKAEPEVKLTLRDPETNEVISEGTADLILTHEDGSLTVIDWKTGVPDKVDAPDENLQLLCYGLAAAFERNAPRFRVGLYFTEYPPLRLSGWIEQ